MQEQQGAGAFERGVEDLSRRRFKRARKLLAVAAREGGERAPWAVQQFVQAFLRAGESEAAETALASLLQDAPRLLRHGRAYLLRFTGRAADAQALLAPALSERPRQWADACELGWLLCVAGRAKEGRALLQRAARHFKREGDAWGLASCLTHLGTLAAREFRLDDALDLLARAADAKRRCGDPLGLASALHNAAAVQFMCADYDAAQLRLAEVHDLQAAAGLRRGTAATWNLMGASHLEVGELEKAAAAFRRALRAAREIPDRLDALANLAFTAQLRGQVRPAQRLHASAMTLARASSEVDVRSMIATVHSQFLVARGRPEEAVALLARVTPHERSLTSPRTLALLLADEASALVEAGDPQAALAAAVASVRLASSIPSTERRLFVPLLLGSVARGRALVALGERSSGIRVLRDACSRMEAVLRAADSASTRMGIVEANRNATNTLVEALLDPAVRRTDEAWRASALLKAREFATASRQRDRAQAMRDAEIRRAAQRAETRGGERRQLRGARRRAEAVVTGRAGEPRTAADVSALLGPDAALLEYQVSARTSHLFVLHRAHVHAVDLEIGERPLTRLVQALLDPLATGQVEALTDEHLHRAFRTLVEPALRILPAQVKRLIIVPDGPLHRVPFSGLVTARPADRPERRQGWDAWAEVQFVADRFTVSVAPTSQLLRRSFRARGAGPTVALAFSPATSTQAGLAPLPGAEEEARGVSLDAAGSPPLLGNEASASALVRALDGSTVVHVAAHGVADQVVPGRSFLQLAPESHRPSGRLTADEIEQIRGRPRVVVLSACDSGAGKVRHREGALSLARAFLVAGTGTVIASLWPVDDRATLHLMSRLHEHLRGGGSPARALAEAQRVARQATGSSGSWAHPFSWAGFVAFSLDPA